MTLNDDGATPVRRRRGAALEEALLTAAWAEITEAGYAAFTIDAVAVRAGTSRAVLYRRWSSKAELVRAAMVREIETDTVRPPDTGSLRSDVVALLIQTNEARTRLATELIPHLSEYWRETGTSIEDLRQSVFGERDSAMDRVLEQAAARGEVDTAALGARVRTLPFDLFRHEVLVTLAPVPEPVIEEIVDTIFLPLVQAAGRAEPVEQVAQAAGRPETTS